MSGPFWSKPLWDSDSNNDGESDGWFSAPSVMSVAKIVGSIAGGGPWLSFALDALDTAANVAMGNMSLKDGALGLAKGAAGAAVSSLGVTEVIGNAAGSAFSWAGDVASSVVTSVAQNYSSTLINGAVNAFNFENGWSMDSFEKSAKTGLKGAAIAGTTALVGGIINSANGQSFGKYKNPDGTTATGWHTMQSGVLDKMSSSISSIGNYWGGLAGQAMSAGLGEGFSLNILNARDLGIGNGGLLEMRFGGKQPMSFGLGGGGADVSDSAMADMAAGYRQLGFMDRVNGSGAPDLVKQAQLAKINMQRWAGGRAAQLAEMEVNGMLGTIYNNQGINSSRGNMTTLGLNDIEVGEDGNITLASQARLAVRGTHEGMHVLQNMAAYSSGNSEATAGMSALDREMGAHAAGISAWQGLLSTFGSGIASTSTGTVNDRAFAGEMSTLSYGLATKQLEKHLQDNYSMTGNDWKRIKYQTPTTVNGQSGLVNRAVMNGNDTMADLYIKLGDVPARERAQVRQSVVDKLKKAYPGMPDNPDDDTINNYLKKMNSGDMTVDLTWSYGKGYGSSAGLYDSEETRRQLQRYKEVIMKKDSSSSAAALVDNFYGLDNQPWAFNSDQGIITKEQAQRLAMENLRSEYNTVMNQLLGDMLMRGPELVNNWKTFVNGKPYDFSGVSHSGDRNGETWDCSSGIYFMLKDKMGYSRLPENMNAKMMLNQLPLSEVTRGELNTGDLVFYDYANSRGAWNHVAMYMNPNQAGLDMLNSTGRSGNHYTKLNNYNSWATSRFINGQQNPYAPATIVYRRIDWIKMERYRGEN